ncbi:MAG: SWIM zinc finger family protein, partial [Lachnospiraceae bacterium]|nr:SWIM zinc finger family protein [Lachnospiraceae bacterium]
MEELKALIQQVDDDYLIGLSNKGTVKRAYKDLEAQTFHHTYNESNIEVTLKDETCTICKPLGESKCTCPSKSICRHRITAILWMKKILEDFSETDSKTEITSTIETNQHIQKSKDADTNDAIRITDTDVEITKKKLQKDLTNNKPERKGDFEVTEENTSPKQTKKNVFKEILEVPLEKLKRACGITKYRQFLSYVRLGEQILIQESSIITVSFSWDNVIVKLLEPLVYSTCTCHSKELCTHKAQAILAYQLQKEVVTIEQLEQALQEEKSLDEVLIRKSAMQICNAICHQMLTGLSRQSQEITEELERLAVIAHRAEIASLENQLRQCITFYQQYFSKNALFRSETLFQKLLQIYKKADVLQIVQKEQMRQLVGTFRDTYELTKDLHLMGIGSRAFQSKSGYEGETYYFLEINQKKWYTWTDARPIFYEDVRQRQMYTIERTIAPWGLGCTREKM